MKTTDIHLSTKARASGRLTLLPSFGESQPIKPCSYIRLGWFVCSLAPEDTPILKFDCSRKPLLLLREVVSFSRLRLQFFATRPCYKKQKIQHPTWNSGSFTLHPGTLKWENKLEMKRNFRRTTRSS